MVIIKEKSKLLTLFKKREEKRSGNWVIYNVPCKGGDWSSCYNYNAYMSCGFNTALLVSLSSPSLPSSSNSSFFLCLSESGKIKFFFFSPKVITLRCFVFFFCPFIFLCQNSFSVGSSELSPTIITLSIVISNGVCLNWIWIVKVRDLFKSLLAFIFEGFSCQKPARAFSVLSLCWIWFPLYLQWDFSFGAIEYLNFPNWGVVWSYVSSLSCRFGFSSRRSRICVYCIIMAFISKVL